MPPTETSWQTRRFERVFESLLDSRYLSNESHDRAPPVEQNPAIRQKNRYRKDLDSKGTKIPKARTID
jgi:hypothetical protein